MFIALFCVRDIVAVLRVVQAERKVQSRVFSGLSIQTDLSKGCNPNAGYASLTLIISSVIKISPRSRCVLSNPRRIFRSSSMAEHPAVNRRVVSSSLTCGATSLKPNGQCDALPFFFPPTRSSRAGYRDRPSNIHWVSYSREGCNSRVELSLRGPGR